MRFISVLTERLADRHDEVRDSLITSAADYHKYLDGVGYLRGFRDAISIVRELTADLEYAPRNTEENY